MAPTPSRRTSRREMFGWMLSQFLHGEQGALLGGVAARRRRCRTWTRSTTRATQVFDEGAPRRGLRSLPAREDRLLVSDLALSQEAARPHPHRLALGHEAARHADHGRGPRARRVRHDPRADTTEPLLKKLTHYVMLDEARHVAYGVLSLKDHYGDMKEAEQARARRLHLRGGGADAQSLLVRSGLGRSWACPSSECKQLTLGSHSQQMFRQMLFSKIVPAIKKMGLLSDRQRARFEQPRHPAVRVLVGSVRGSRGRHLRRHGRLSGPRGRRVVDAVAESEFALNCRLWPNACRRRLRPSGSQRWRWRSSLIPARPAAAAAHAREFAGRGVGGAHDSTGAIPRRRSRRHDAICGARPGGPPGKISPTAETLTPPTRGEGRHESPRHDA